MKKLTIPCDFGGKKIPFPIYVGEPHGDEHPLRFQAAWIRRERGGVIPVEVMDSFGKLHKISKENNVSFEDLCVYALGEAGRQQQAMAAAKQTVPAPQWSSSSSSAPPPQEPPGTSEDSASSDADSTG